MTKTENKTPKEPNGTLMTVPNGFGWKVIFVPYENETKKAEKKELKTND